MTTDERLAAAHYLLGRAYDTIDWLRDLAHEREQAQIEQLLADIRDPNYQPPKV